MKPRKHILLAVLITFIYTAIFFAVGHFAFNPGVGEGNEFDPNSARYRIGVILDHQVTPIIAIPMLPYALVRDGLHISGSFDMILAPIYVFAIAYFLLLLIIAKPASGISDESKSKDG